MAQKNHTTNLTELLLQCVAQPDPMLSMLELSPCYLLQFFAWFWSLLLSMMCCLKFCAASSLESQWQRYVCRLW